MVFAKITGGGLSSIAVLVAVLWSCIVGEHLILQHANRELAKAMSEMRMLQKKRILPVSAPKQVYPLRPALG